MSLVADKPKPNLKRKAPDSPFPVFKGLKIAVVEGSTDLPRQRVEFLERLIRARQGQVVDPFESKRVDLLIVSANANPDSAKRWLRGVDVDAVADRAHSPDCITEAIRTGKLPPKSAFRVWIGGPPPLESVSTTAVVKREAKRDPPASLQPSTPQRRMRSEFSPKSPTDDEADAGDDAGGKEAAESAAKPAASSRAAQATPPRAATAATKQEPMVKQESAVKPERQLIRAPSAGLVEHKGGTSAALVPFGAAQPNLNKHLTDEFGRLETIYAAAGDDWRKYAYRKVVGILTQYPKKIETVEDAKELLNVKGVGRKSYDKVVELLETGKLRRLDHLDADHKVKVLQLFVGIHGVNYQTAEKWYKRGYRTLDDIRKHEYRHLLPPQRLGLDMYEDRMKRIPRAEVEVVEKIVARVAQKMLPETIVQCCGSYRRGADSSGDCDILMTHHSADPDVQEKRAALLGRLVHALSTCKPPFLTGTLGLSENGQFGKSAFMGFCKVAPQHLPELKADSKEVSGINRRIDIKMYRPEHYAFAVLYFTGSEHFNRSMRNFARKKQMKLSDHELAPCVRRNRERIWTGPTVPCKTEEDVFFHLGVDYVPPELRYSYRFFDEVEEQLKIEARAKREQQPLKLEAPRSQPLAALAAPAPRLLEAPAERPVKAEPGSGSPQVKSEHKWEGSFAAAVKQEKQPREQREQREQQHVKQHSAAEPGATAATALDLVSDSDESSVGSGRSSPDFFARSADKGAGAGAGSGSGSGAGSGSGSAFASAASSAKIKTEPMVEDSDPVLD